MAKTCLIALPLVSASLFCIRYSRESNPAGDAGRVCSALPPSSSSPTFYVPSQAHNSRHYLKQQCPSLFLWSGLINPMLGFLSIVVFILLQNFKHTEHVFGLSLIERNVSCFPMNLPCGSEGH